MSCAVITAERITRTNMTNTEANTAATVAEQGAPVAPEKATLKKKTSPKKGAPKGAKNANAGKAKKEAKPAKEGKATAKATKTKKAVDKSARKQASTPRAESKGAKILELIGRAKGATLAELMEATGWQAHSVRGFISTVGKKQNLTIESSKSESGERVYKLAK